MAGDSNIYVVYNPDIENSVILNKFLTVVLDKAKFPVSKIQFKTEDEYLQLLKDGSKNYVICLNKTYTEVSIQTGLIISEQPFKFFSRHYQNKSKNIYILGLLNNLDELFDDKNEALKRATWTKLKSFLTTYEETSSGMSSTPVKELPKDPAPVKSSLPIKDSLQTDIVKDTVEVLDIVLENLETKEVEDPVTIVEVVETESAPKPSYEDLLEFYNLTSSLLRDFDILMTLNKKIGDTL